MHPQNNHSDEDVIVVDATTYVSIVAQDRFSPNHLVTLLIDPEEIASIVHIGYGVLDGVRTPVVQLNYKNGQAEQVFDAYAVWTH